MVRYCRCTELLVDFCTLRSLKKIITASLRPCKGTELYFFWGGTTHYSSTFPDMLFFFEGEKKTGSRFLLFCEFIFFQTKMVAHLRKTSGVRFFLGLLYKTNKFIYIFQEKFQKMICHHGKKKLSVFTYTLFF